MPGTKGRKYKQSRFRSRPKPPGNGKKGSYLLLCGQIDRAHSFICCAILRERIIPAYFYADVTIKQEAEDTTVLSNVIGTLTPIKDEHHDGTRTYFAMMYLCACALMSSVFM